MIKGVLNCVPDQQKIAEVIPVFKTDGTIVISNYRPFSILPVFLHVYARLINYIIKQKILYNFQFGFRKVYN